MLKSITRKVDGYTREVLFVNVNGGKNVGSKGQINQYDIGEPSDKRQGQSNSASKSVGQGPKDKALRKLDEIAKSQSTGGVKHNARRHKPTKHKPLRGDGRLPSRTGKGVLRVSAWRAK